MAATVDMVVDMVADTAVRTVADTAGMVADTAVVDTAGTAASKNTSLFESANQRYTPDIERQSCRSKSLLLGTEKR